MLIEKTEMAITTKKACIHVLGCKVNQAEAASMARILEQYGYRIDTQAKDPDLIVINTCCVTLKSEAKSRRLVHKLAEKHPSAVKIVTGCLAEINPSSLTRGKDGILVLNTFDKARFEEFVAQVVKNEAFPGISAGRDASCCTEFGNFGVSDIHGRSRAFLKIQDGCSQRCSYCIVPSSRGPSRSLAPDLVSEQAKQLEAAGCPEIVLTGIHLGCYGKDLDKTVSIENLVKSLHHECSGTRFRLSSIEPQELSDKLIEFARTGIICPHFHIPLQSGDDAILAKMGRPYRTEKIRLLMERINRTVPDACIGFDVMVGFPGEDEESFARTRIFIEELNPTYLHVFAFSPRPGTPAAAFQPRVSPQAAAERVERLRELSGKLRRSFFERFIGRELQAVAETDEDHTGPVVKARTDNYIPVILNGLIKPVKSPFTVVITGVSDEEATAVHVT